MLRGAGSVFSLLHSGNSIGMLAADIGVVRLADEQSLAVGTVDGIVGVTTSTIELSANGNLVIGGTGVLSGKVVTLDTEGKAVEDPSGRIDAALLNGTAKTGIKLDGNNNIAAVGTNQTKSGPDIINQH